MTAVTLGVAIDTIEPRVSRERIAILADGRHWDTNLSSAYVDGITGTGMLMPLPLKPEWQTTTTGLYKRFRKADYSFYQGSFIPPGTPPPYDFGTPADDGKWVEFNSPYAGNVYLQGQGVNDLVVTHEKFPANRPLFMSWFSYNAGQTSVVQLECGWISETLAVMLRFWTDGKCEIWKNGFFVGEGNITERQITTQGDDISRKVTRHRAKRKHSRGDKRQMAQQVVEVMLIPCRSRDLLIISNQGGGFTFTFDDIDPDDPNPIITGDQSNFFWKVPVGQPSVLCAPLNFDQEGTLISTIRTTRLKPGATETPDYGVYYDFAPYGDLTYEANLFEPNVDDIDDLVIFVPDGEKNQVRIGVDLTGDGTSTTFIYGASAVFPALIENTAGGHTTYLDEFIIAANLAVPESPTDLHFSIDCHSPYAAEMAGTSQLLDISNRPCQVGMSDGDSDSFAFFVGRSQAPKWVDGINDRASRFSLEFRDNCKAMEECRIQDPVPVDAFELADGLAHFAMLPGYPDTMMDIPEFGFRLPRVGQTSGGEFALMPEVGDTALEWFQKLWKTYARHTRWGWVPDGVGSSLRIRTIDELEIAAPVLTLYPTIADAIDNGIDPEFAPYYQYRSYKPKVIECEANDIWVTGRNPRTGNPFQVHYGDKLSKDPTLAPADRPKNWLGEPRNYGWVDQSITTIEAATWVCTTLARRLVPARKVIPFTSFFLFNQDNGLPIWKFDKVTLWPIGDVLINTFESTFENEVAADGVDVLYDKIWRPTTYTGDLVEVPTI